MKKAGKIFIGTTLEIAIEEAVAFYLVPQEKLSISILQDAKMGVFGIIPARKAEIRACVSESQQGNSSKGNEEDKPKIPMKEKKEKTPHLEAETEEPMLAVSVLPVTEQDSITAIIMEVLTKILKSINSSAHVQVLLEENTFCVTVEETEDTRVLVGKETEVLIAIQYIMYKIIVQQVRCFFSLSLQLGQAVVSEETILIATIQKLIAKVKLTQKTQRTYPLSKAQRALVEQLVEKEALVSIKNHDSDAPLQSVVLLYQKVSE